MILSRGFKIIIHSFDIQNQIADTLNRIGKSVAISKRYNILIYKWKSF